MNPADPAQPLELDRDQLPTRPEIMGRIIDPSDRFAFQMSLDLLEPTSDLQETIRSQRDRFMAARQPRIAPTGPG